MSSKVNYKEFLCTAYLIWDGYLQPRKLKATPILDDDPIIIRAEIKSPKWHIASWQAGEVPPSMIATQSITTVFEGELVWKGINNLSIWQTKDGMLRQMAALERVATATQNYGFWLATLTVAENLILMLVRQGKLDPAVIEKLYIVFEKTRNLALSTTFKGEQATAAGKALAIAKRIIK